MKGKSLTNKDELADIVREFEFYENRWRYLRGLRDFTFFCENILGIGSEKFGQKPLAPAHYDLMRFINEPETQKLILMPRSHLKSTIVTEAWSLWRIVKDPNIRIFIANATLSNARKFLSTIKNYMEFHPEFRKIYGNFCDEKHWTQDSIIVKGRTQNVREPTIQVAGMGGNLVSQHFSVMIFDDIVNEDNVATRDQIEKTLLWYKLAHSLKDNPKSEIIVIGTRYSFNDLYGWILEEPGIVDNYKVIIRKIVEEGEILWPAKFSKEEIAKLKMEQGTVVFSNQYMNEPIDEETAYFKRSYFKYKVYEDLEEPLRIYVTADLAISEKKHADWTCFIVNAVDKHKNWNIVEIVHARMSAKEIIDKIFDIYDTWGQDSIFGIEDGTEWMAIKPYYVDEMRRRMKYPKLRELKTLKGKFSDDRIRGLEPLYRSGLIFHIKGTKNIDILEDELLKFTKSRFDDCADALAHQLFLAKLAAKQHNEIEDEDKKKRYEIPMWLK